MRWRVAVAALALGAAGCGGTNGPRGVVDPVGSVTLQEVQAVIFTPTCARSGCHLGPGSPFGLDLSVGKSLGNTVGVPSSEVPAFLRVAPFDPAGSYLFMKVSGDPRIQGDRMPAFEPPLSASELQLIFDWIEQGARP